MRSDKELAATVCAAMKRKGLDAKTLGEKLQISKTMVKKVMSGDIVPSRHLDRQLTVVLGIPAMRLARIAGKREQKSRTEQLRDSRTRPAPVPDGQAAASKRPATAISSEGYQKL